MSSQSSKNSGPNQTRDARQRGDILGPNVLFFPGLASKDKDNPPATSSPLKVDSIYEEYRLEREEILKHKWIESEKAGRDVGWEFAMVDWTLNYRAAWIRQRRQILARKNGE